VDLKPILNIHVTLQYIFKYASKAESRSIAFSEIFNQILNNNNSDDSLLISIQKLLFNNIIERDISAQKTYYFLFSIPLYHSNQSFVLLNINEKIPRWIQETDNNKNGDNFSNETGCITQSNLKKY